MTIAPTTPALGAHVNGGATSFALFTTTASQCAVALIDRAGRRRALRAMRSLGDGYFAARIGHAPHGTLYKFVLDGVELPDPYAHCLPHGVHGPAMVVEPLHTWRHLLVDRPLREQVIYELHVGSFTEEGTYEAAMQKLPELARLGITTIELMPVSSFPGTRGWGYDGVAHFAPFAPYGAPDQLRRFVDDAHGLGLGVLLDVVYNHFGPSGNYLPAYSPTYFTKDLKTPWGDAPDFTNPVMRRYVLDNARYWLTGFRFEGLRLDATHVIVDASPRHIVDELAAAVAKIEPRKLLIAEDDRNEPEMVTRTGVDAIWADDFHHQVHVTLTGEHDGYYAAFRRGASDLARTLRGGWLYEGQVSAFTAAPRGRKATGLAAEQFVYCIQNHDQVGNRALGERLSELVPIEAYRAVAMLLLALPMTPLVFMGQEWAASTPFLFFTDHERELGERVTEGRRREFQSFTAFRRDGAGSVSEIPDPQSADTFVRSRLRWREREQEPHREVLELYRDMLALRSTDPVLRGARREDLVVDARGDVLVVQLTVGSEVRILLVNLGATKVILSDIRVHARALRTMIASSHIPEAEILPPWTAVLLADRL